MYYYGGYSGYGNNCCCNSGYPSYGGGYGYGGGAGYGAAIILVLFILLVIVIGARAFNN
ncbi:MAG: sporulation protein YjcZ [Bacilli bacterium]|nr:sporulation protein YjcZ [Bacilli bacterium]MCI8544874.1 sporulation protein YjcZ [Bacilli bacterium]MCI9234327.1 sporulation protein YjcZ [Bacilli bacterium]